MSLVLVGFSSALSAQQKMFRSLEPNLFPSLNHPASTNVSLISVRNPMTQSQTCELRRAQHIKEVLDLWSRRIFIKTPSLSILRRPLANFDNNRLAISPTPPPPRNNGYRLFPIPEEVAGDLAEHCKCQLCYVRSRDEWNFDETQSW